MSESYSIKITINPSINGDCPYCRGKGYICFMQSAACINGPSIRDRDVLVRCTLCHGTGKIKQEG